MDLIVSDETLRDGEQQVGVNFSAAHKERITKELCSAGVHQISIMPAISKQEEKIAKKLVGRFGSRMCASTMLGKKFIDHSHSCGFKNIILFAPLSERLLKLDGSAMSKNIETSANLCRYACNKGLNVVFAGEDSSRAAMKYVTRFVKRIEKFVGGFIACDTVGVLTPQKTKKMTNELVEKTNCKIGVHFHNDRGLANKNTVAAVKAGARIISGTFGGIGERAGNADLCSVLLELKKGGFAAEGIDYQNLPKLKKLACELGGSRPARPFSRRAFWHESGIHVHGLIKDPLSYNSVLPEKYGKRNEIFFGKFSGVSNYRYLLGDKHPAEKLVGLRDKIKGLAYKNNRSYSAKEVLRLSKFI